MRIENLQHFNTSELLESDFYGLDVWEDDKGERWVIALNADKATEAANKHTHENVWMGNINHIVSALDCCLLLENCPDYVADDRELDEYGECPYRETMYVVSEYLKELQESCESSNDAILEVIGEYFSEWADYVIRIDGLDETLNQGEEGKDFTDLSEDLQQALASHYGLSEEEKSYLTAYNNF